MPDALDKLRRHENIYADERALLDFQVCSGPATRTALATLLTAMLCDRVEGFHGNPSGYLEAGHTLVEALLQHGVDNQLLTAEQARRGRLKLRETFTPKDLLTLWGETRIGLESIRRRKAMQRYDQQHPPQELAA